MPDSNKTNSRNKANAYFPGMYHKTMPKIYDIIESAFNEWKEEKKSSTRQAPIICISRKIGVGSYQIAEIAAQKIHYRVYDREILEHLISDREVDKSIKHFLDERSPSGIENLLAKLLGEAVFKSDYAKLLFKAIFTIANFGPCIFVGRGAHLVLPRERILAVRVTCSDKFRNRRLARMLNISETAASLRLAHLDLEQKNFFKNVYNLKSAPKEEFDMVLYMDYLDSPQRAAGIIVSAFGEKFGAASHAPGKEAL